MVWPIPGSSQQGLSLRTSPRPSHGLPFTRPRTWPPPQKYRKLLIEIGRRPVPPDSNSYFCAWKKDAEDGPRRSRPLCVCGIRNPVLESNLRNPALDPNPRNLTLTFSPLHLIQRFVSIPHVLTKSGVGWGPLGGSGGRDPPQQKTIHYISKRIYFLFLFQILRLTPGRVGFSHGIGVTVSSRAALLWTCLRQCQIESVGPRRVSG